MTAKDKDNDCGNHGKGRRRLVRTITGCLLLFLLLVLITILIIWAVLRPTKPRLVLYATYRNQQVTLRTSLPPTYQGHNENSVWSPFVYGNSVPIAPDFSAALNSEQASGSVFMVIRIDGRVRWKVGTFVSGRYRLNVRCPAYITFGSRSNGVSVGENAVKYQLVTRCSVSV
ncbi:hypothetical protein V6N13_015324 [Hibiscus sabdariffa]